MLTSLFSTSKVACILAISLSMEEEEDKLIWAYSKDGQYSLEVPPKIKNFIWRVCWQAIGVGKELK
uniref:Uncharacterized protein n=1 Tax=Nelumbo nucifera TaxID=4432 RepID=A0A822YHI7_NELNU|nr:TPA_asm: hypothetical protein HUJ06_009296 [Nelumbo nucifera]